MNRKGYTLILRKAFTLGDKKAYTLIELLTVVAIIGVLVTIGSYVWASVAAAERDNTRKTDLARIKNVLEQYNTDTRSYPTFDTSQGAGRLYAAEWQLADSSTCPHAGNINKRLTPTYFDQVPRDPRYQFKFQSGCGSAHQQSGIYLYVSSPGATAPPTNSSATGYALLATLEKTKDQTDPLDNPIRSFITKFAYYSNRDTFGNCLSGDCVTDFPYNMDANYVVFSNNTR